MESRNHQNDKKKYYLNKHSSFVKLIYDAKQKKRIGTWLGNNMKKPMFIYHYMHIYQKKKKISLKD